MILEKDIKHWDEHLCKQHVVNEINQLIAQLKDKKSIKFLDIGANVGKFYDVFSERYDIDSCILVEPNPYLAEYLNKKFNTPEVIVIDKAVTDDSYSGKANFYINPTVNNLGLSKLDKHNGNFLVDTIKFSDLLENYWHSIKDFDFIKIDTENHDFNLLEVLYKKLITTNFRPIIAFENNFKGYLKEDQAKSIYDTFINNLNYKGPEFKHLPGDVVIYPVI